MSGRSSKHPGWLIFGGLILLLVLTVALCEWLEWPFLRGPLERTLSRTLGREVSLGPDFGVRLIGPIRMHDDAIVIGSPPGGPD
ncbi:MAG: AsmA family protein, partial [Gammaproteobacteria bacterium]